MFPYSYIETRLEVWENEKLKWEHKPVGRVFPRNFEFSQTSTSVSILTGLKSHAFICRLPDLFQFYLNQWKHIHVLFKFQL